MKGKKKMTHAKHEEPKHEHHEPKHPHKKADPVEEFFAEISAKSTEPVFVAGVAHCKERIQALLLKYATGS